MKTLCTGTLPVIVMWLCPFVPDDICKLHAPGARFMVESPAERSQRAADQGETGAWLYRTRWPPRDEADAVGPSQGQSWGQEFLGWNPAANHRQMVGGPSKPHSILFSGTLDLSSNALLCFLSSPHSGLMPLHAALSAPSLPCACHS